MKKLIIPVLLLSLLVPVALLFHGCATLTQFGEAISNLQRLKFRLSGVSGFTLAGINISRKRSLSDITLGDGFRLMQAFRSRRLPAGFILNIEAINPNDGTGGSTNTVSTLTSFDWRLLIDDRPTISGDLERPIEIPGTGRSAFFPLRMEIDLVEFFGDRGYEDLLDLALALGGQRSDISRLALDAQPRVSTPIGEIYWPGRITIIDRDFR